MTDHSLSFHNHGNDVQVVEYDNKILAFVGTAHISQETVDVVQRVIEEELPDFVCLELDDKRYQTLTEKLPWQSLCTAELVNEMGETLPDLIRVLIDERDNYLVGKIKASPGKRIVAVVGAGQLTINSSISLHI